MRTLVLFASVLWLCQANRVCGATTNTVLKAPPPTVASIKEPNKTQMPAQMVELTKDHGVPDHVMKKVVMTTISPIARTIMTSVAEKSKAKQTERGTRAAPSTGSNKHSTQTSPQHTVINEGKEKSTLVHKMSAHRSMRSVAPATTTVQTLMVTETPAVKSVNSSTIMSTIDPCDLLCTKFEFEPICATNGFCLHEFPNQCILETYNCRHTTGKFKATKGDSCQMNLLSKCDESEMI